MSSLNNNSAYTAATWKKYTVGFAALQTAGLTITVNVASLPAKGVIHAAKIVVTTAFSGGAIATLTASVGRSGSVAKYVVASDITGAGALDGVAITVPILESTSGATTITLTAVAVGANLSALTQGSLDVYLYTSQLE